MRKETKQGWVDLSGLARKGNGIDWNASVGRAVPFKYLDVESTILIKAKVSLQYVLIDIPGYVENREIYVGQIKNGQLATCVGKRVADHAYEVGDTVGGIKIIDRFWRHEPSSHKYYRCKCLIDGYEWELREEHMKNGVGCPVCAGKAVMPGLNDIHTLAPHLEQFLANIEDAYRYAPHTNKELLWRCPVCGYEKLALGSLVANNGFSCPYCSDGVSFPNKFVRSVLRQISQKANCSEFSLRPEHTFEWSRSVEVPWRNGKKRMVYDIYIPELNTIIENHGAQHYPEVGRSFNTGYEEIHRNDMAKKELAMNNGIEYYVELDCRESTMEHIRESIMKSVLPEVVGFCEDDVDWMLAYKDATTSLVVRTCELWSSGVHPNSAIAREMGINVNTVSRYLKRGREIGLITDAA